MRPRSSRPLYLAVADDKYRAEADLLVSPASQNDTALTGLPVIHESSDPTRDVETAARLVDEPRRGGTG